MADVGARAEVEAQMAEASAWLQSDDARATAASELLRLGLRGEDVVDDVLGEVTLHVLRRLVRRGALAPKGDGSSGVVAHCRRSLRNAAVDVARGPRLRSLDQLLVDAAKEGAEGRRHQDPAAADDVELEVAEEVVALELADDLRRALFLSLDARQAWRWSAALALVALVRNPALAPREGTPEPDASAVEQRLPWAALHHAGRDDCFSDRIGSPDAACRLRRSRSLQQVGAVLEHATATVAGGVVPR